MNASVLLTPPSAEPVSLDEVKLLARVTHAADDALIALLMKSARQWAEAYTRRAAMTQTWALYVSGMPRTNRIMLPKGPLLSVAQIEFFDDHDNASVWDQANYFVNLERPQGEIVLRSGATWPLAQRCANGMVVTYDAGYGADPSSVPEDFKLAIKQLAVHWYENRGEAVQAANYAKPPLTIEALLNPYRLLSVGGSCA